MKLDRSAVLALALLLYPTLGASRARAESPTPAAVPTGLFTIDEQDPEAHLPTPEQADKHPMDWGYLLMGLNDRADAARKRGDWKASLKYDRAAAKLVPDRAVSYSLLCKDYRMLGQRPEALTACSGALRLEGATLDDFVNYVHLVADRPGGVDAQEVVDAKTAIAHLKKDPKAQLAGYELQCELSLQTRDQTSLAECSKELRKAAPQAARPTGFAWALAVMRSDFPLARKLLKEAKQRGLDARVLERMERTTTAAEKGDVYELERAKSEVPAQVAPPAADADNGRPGGGAPASSSLAASPAAARSVVSADSSLATAGSLSADSASLPTRLHPMLAWLVGLIVALLVAVPLARRFTRSSV